VIKKSRLMLAMSKVVAVLVTSMILMITVLLARGESYYEADYAEFENRWNSTATEWNLIAERLKNGESPSSPQLVKKLKSLGGKMDHLRRHSLWPR
jgi:hypothetical protein